MIKAVTRAVLFAIIARGATGCLAQNTQSVDSLFFQGIATYKNGRYAESLNIMETQS